MIPVYAEMTALRLTLCAKRDEVSALLAGTDLAIEIRPDHRQVYLVDTAGYEEPVEVNDWLVRIGDDVLIYPPDVFDAIFSTS